MNRRSTGLLGLLVGLMMTLRLLAPAAANDPGLIDTSVEGVVTVNLTDSSGEWEAGPGGEIVLSGITFTLTRVDGIDLTTQAGWDAAIAFAQNPVLPPNPVREVIFSPPTDAAGLTTFEHVPVGLYLLQQIDRPAGVPTVPDMAISMPMMDPVTHGWVYEVDLYAKSGPSSIVKTVNDGNAGTPGQDAPVAGQVLTYNFTAAVSHGGYAIFGGTCQRAGATDLGDGRDEFGFTPEGVCADGATWTGTAGGAGFRLVDDLTHGIVPGTPHTTADFVEFTASDWDGVVEAFVYSAGNATELVACQAGVTAGCDYTITKTASRLQFDLTDQGMQALAAARVAAEDTELLVTAQGRIREAITEVTALDPLELETAAYPIVLHLPNTVQMFPNGPAIESGTASTSPTVTTRYSTLRLHKITASEENLAGAVFTLYRTLDDAKSGTNPLSVSEPTNELGMTQFPGLQVTDFQDNTADDDSYWVVETTTPDGYVGLVGPFEVKLTSDGVTLGADQTGGYPIVNSPEGGYPPNPSTNPSEPPTVPGIVIPQDPTRPGLLPATGVALALSTVVLTAVLTLGGGTGITGIIASSRKRKQD